MPTQEGSTDFRGLQASYARRETGCVFCPLEGSGRVLLSGFRQLDRAAELVGKYVGGMYAVRDLPGTTNRPAYTPVEPARQREALQFLSQGLFTVDSFRFRPEFLSGLAPDYNEWDRGGLVPAPSPVLSMTTTAAVAGAPSAGGGRGSAALTAAGVGFFPSFVPRYV